MKMILGCEPITAQEALSFGLAAPEPDRHWHRQSLPQRAG